MSSKSELYSEAKELAKTLNLPTPSYKLSTSAQLRNFINENKPRLRPAPRFNINDLKNARRRILKRVPTPPPLPNFNTKHGYTSDIRVNQLNEARRRVLGVQKQGNNQENH
mmetsp:Transcript_28586/g.40300  ORF Transcript_28586/g.40300 Transcript_28586/m.40300 type:complete len:111 (-) Transcript_28586:898-1230(-)